MGRLRMMIDSELANVDLVAVSVHKICSLAGFTDSRADQVELCVVEALTNVIRHAYHGQHGRTVSIDVSTAPDEVTIEISDNGVAMQPEHEERLIRGVSVPEEEHSDQASLPEGGRGLHIIHELMNHVAYCRDGEFNRLTLSARAAA
jgi:serine/threonine-protein kinase RsbW